VRNVKLDDFDPPLTADERAWLVGYLKQIEVATATTFKKIRVWMVPWAPTPRLAQTNIVDVYRSEHESDDA